MAKKKTEQVKEFDLLKVKELQDELRAAKLALKEATRFTHLPRVVRIESIGKKTKIIDEGTGDELYDIDKLKVDFGKSGYPQATMTFTAAVLSIDVLEEQIPLFNPDQSKAK